LWLLAPAPRESSIGQEGQADGVDSVQDGVKGDAGCGGNAVLGFGLDKGVERVGWFGIEIGEPRTVRRIRGRLGYRLWIHLRIRDLRRGGVGFGKRPTETPG